MRRVVVTGLGLITPLASDVEGTWSRLIAGKSGARPITKFPTDDMATKIACNVVRGDGADGTFNADAWVDPKDQRRMDDFIVFGLAAAQQAVTDSGWQPGNEDERCRTGVLIGSGIGGLVGIAEGAIVLHEKGPRKISPFFIPGRLINLVSGYASIRFGYKGPNHAVVTACATGAHAIGDAARMIALDDADVMLAG
ncbi:MAG: beta-ketoacyl-ACP synthase II, partial [Alphaproteobacteria bacterium]|nr:beta-ketoacyl-ACP synthase II [Alphaproteobacteria bacterium]